MTGGLSGADVGIVSAAVAVVLFAIAYAVLRGDRRDPLERLAGWARTKELGYVAPERDTVLASFVGDVDGYRIEVTVVRVARGFGNDLPPTVTTVQVGATAGAFGRVPICILQPAAWILDRDGHAVGERVPSDDEVFDDAWSARGTDAGAVKRTLSPPLRARLMRGDAEGLSVEIATGVVAISMPGICAEPGELDRRLAVASSLARVLLDH